MRKNFLKTIFIVIGIIAVFFSIGFTLAVFFKKFTIELADNYTSEEEDFLPNEDVVVVPVIICTDNDEESDEPQNI